MFPISYEKLAYSIQYPDQRAGAEELGHSFEEMRGALQVSTKSLNQYNQYREDEGD
jgi:hypothetical protein